MIPTFVITLREGVEASLIVGIIAAFLVKEGRQDAMRQMWIGVAIAIALCGAVAVALRLIGEQLPQQQQEGLETVVGLIAVSTISYMIIWMRRHARGIKAELEGEAASALATGSTMALVGMAFLAVLREGFETSVFLLAAFQDAADTTAAGTGAVLGLAAASRSASASTAAACGSTSPASSGSPAWSSSSSLPACWRPPLHTAHEAGWINGLQSQALDLTWLVQPGTVSGSLLTGMLGLQPKPTVVEAAAYLLYAVPMALYVLWPDRLRRRRRAPAGPPGPGAGPEPGVSARRFPAMSPFTRRRLLASAGVGAAGVGLGGATGFLIGQDDAPRQSRRDRPVDFYGEHQAGIDTPAQDRLHFAAFDLVDDDPRRAARADAASGPRRRPK